MWFLTWLTLTFVRLRCESDDFFWSLISVLKFIQLETSSFFFKFLTQGCVLASWSDKEEMLLGLLLENCSLHLDTRTLTLTLTHALPLKSEVDTCGICLVTVGEELAAFFALSEMLTAV